jgi:MraZ protein
MRLKMDRFLSNTINRVDRKGRVSIPAPFRAILAGLPSLHVILNVDRETVDCGGPDLLRVNEARLAQMDPFSEEYEFWSFHLMGDTDQLKIDPEGRIALTANIREHTGIDSEVVFVGRGNFFQMWEPSRFHEYRSLARSKVSALRKRLGPADGTSASPPGGRTGEPRNGQDKE